MRKTIWQRGDTIIEVLISLGVLSAVIAGSYSIVNVALRNSRQAQERAEATKLAESHLEMIKAIQNGVEGVDPASVPNNVPFCIGTPTTPGLHTSTIMPPADFLQDTFSSESYRPACKNRNGLYNIFVVKAGVNYTVNVRWNRIGGGKEQAQMVYRGYEE